MGETFITGIGQGYIQTNPLQLCLMTAQLANGGYKIYPRITINKNQESAEEIRKKMLQAKDEIKKRKDTLFNVTGDLLRKKTKYKSLVRNHENIKFVLDAMFRSTNEVYGTSYGSRIDDPKYQFAGKTGTSQVKRITEEELSLIHI